MDLPTILDVNLHVGNPMTFRRPVEKDPSIDVFGWEAVIHEGRYAVVVLSSRAYD